MKPGAYGPFPYIPIVDRPRIEWPDGARVAFWVIPNIEVFRLDERMPSGPGRIPDVSAWGARDYGNRIGVFRVLEAMERHGVPGTAALNSDCCDVHPQIVQACLDQGWELMGHCETNTRRLNEEPSEQDARRAIRRTLDRIQAFSGVRPAGWLGAGRQETWETLEHLAAEGCVYTADWDNDDQPVRMSVAGRSFVGLPYGAGLSDKQHFELRFGNADDFETMVRRAFDVLYAESADSGRVVALSLHPYIIGVPHRIGALSRSLQHIVGHEGVWATTGGQIARWFLDASTPAPFPE